MTRDGDIGSCLWQFAGFLQNIEQGVKSYILDNQCVKYLRYAR